MITFFIQNQLKPNIFAKSCVCSFSMIICFLITLGIFVRFRSQIFFLPSLIFVSISLFLPIVKHYIKIYLLKVRHQKVLMSIESFIFRANHFLEGYIFCQKTSNRIKFQKLSLISRLVYSL